MNERMFDAINGLAGRWPVLDGLARFGANDAIFLLGAMLAILGAREVIRRPRAGLTAGLSGVAALGLTGLGILLFGHLFHEQRPFIGDPDTRLLIKHAADNSFPSDHAAVAAAAAVAGAVAWPKWAPALLSVAFVVGLARIVAGLHLPGDILGGWMLGSVSALVAYKAVAIALAKLGTIRRPAGATGVETSG